MRISRFVSGLRAPNLDAREAHKIKFYGDLRTEAITRRAMTDEQLQRFIHEDCAVTLRAHRSTASSFCALK